MTSQSNQTPPSQQPPPMPSGTQGPMPRFLGHSGQQYSHPHTQQPQPTEQGYDVVSWMWPSAMWMIVLFNAAVMGCTLVGMGSNYNSWHHAEAAGISVLTLAVLAIIYKWVLQGPDGLPNRMPLLPRLPAR